MGAMAAMSCEGERERKKGGVVKKAVTERALDTILGRRFILGRSPSPCLAPSVSCTEEEEVSPGKLKQVRVRALKRQVGSQQYLDRNTSDFEPESEGQFDSEHSSGSESSEIETSDDGGLSDSAGEGKTKKPEKMYICEQCGVTAAKPALLAQHKRSHLKQKPFPCPESGCGCAYKRKDHLNRHMKKHQGVVYFCTQPGCGQKFSLNSNLQRHLKHHDELKQLKSFGDEMHICSWPGCNVAFKYPSLLRTHELRVHEKLQYAECICMYPGCGDKFASEKAVVEHAETCHPYLLCEICGETVHRKSFSRHVRRHAETLLEVVCPYDGCENTYSKASNLRVHVRSVHLKLKPFVCSHEGCNKTYAHKAARDRHAQSAVHSLPTIDFEDQDELCLSRPRGGREPVAFDKVETYLKKQRVDHHRP